MLTTRLRRSFTFALALALALHLTVGQAAEPSGILANTATFKASGVIVESHKEKLATRPIGGGQREVIILLSGSLRATFKGDLSGVNTGAFNPETAVSVTFGNRTLNTTLGSDPNYVAGKKSASFEIIEDVAFVGLITTGKITFSWTPKLLTVSVSNFPIYDEAIVSDFLGQTEKDNVPKPFAGKVTVSVGIAGATGARTLFYGGSALTTVKTLSLGGGATTTEQCFSASLSGAFDIKAPVLKSKFPTKATPAPFDIDAAFFDTDNLVSASLTENDAPAPLASLTIDNTSEPGLRVVKITGLTLSVGKHKLVLTVKDESGNVVFVKKTVTVKEAAPVAE